MITSLRLSASSWPRAGAVIAFGGLADDEEGVGIAGDLAATGVVAVDEPLPRLQRLVAFAVRVEQPRLDPAGGEVVGIALQGGGGRLVGTGPVAMDELEIGEGRVQVGVFGLGFGADVTASMAAAYSP